MLREQLLKLIAVAGYDVGFGSKTHFATFDIVEKAPGWLGLASLVGGIYSLYVPFWASQHVAAAFVVFGVISLYIGLYGTEKSKYEEVGKALTADFHELHVLYRKVEALPPSSDASAFLPEFEKVRTHANSIGVSKQIFMSDWYAHYKFFWQMQVDWINEARPFRLLRDKIPLSAYFAVAAIVVLSVLYLRGDLKQVTAAAAPTPCAAAATK
jgi:hypothetical protein